MRGHVEDLLSAYMDGELSLPERGMVEAHLAACDACSRHLDQLAAVDAALRELPAEAPAEYFESFPARLRARLRQPAPARTVRRLPAWTWAAAAALVVAVIAPLTLRETRFQPAAGSQPGPAAPMAAPADVPAPQQADEHKARGGWWPFEKPASRDATPGPTPVTRQATRSPAARTPSTEAARPAAPPAPVTSQRADAQEIASREEPQPPSWAEPPSAAPTRQQSVDTPDQRLDDSLQPGSPQIDAQAELRARPTRVAPEPTQALQGAVAEGRAERDARREVSGVEGEDAEASRTAGLAGATESANAQKTVAARGRPTPALGAGRARTSASGDEEFESLRARNPTDLESARELRDLWRAFAARNPAGVRGDLARLQVIEAGYRALRLGRDARDREVLIRDARTYLERDDGQHVARVRALLADAERP